MSRFSPSIRVFRFFNLGVLVAGAMISVATHASDQNCNEAQSPEKALGQTFSLRELLNFPEEFRDVLMAKCRRDVPSTKDMEDWLAIWGSKERIDSNQHGIHFVNQSPKLLDLFDQLTTFRAEDGSYRQYQFQTRCSEVICAAKEIFGDREGIELLYLLSKFGMNASPFPFGKNYQFWTANELEPVIQAIENFPPGMLLIRKSKMLARLKKGIVLKSEVTGGCVAGTADIATANMQFYDCFFQNPLYMQERIAFHELGHYVGIESGLHDSNDWLKLSHWKEMTIPNGRKGFITKWEPGILSCFASTYAKTNPQEDFAETMVAYRYSPVKLKFTCPAKYNFMRDSIFDGIEYTDQKLCDNRSVSWHRSQ